MDKSLQIRVGWVIISFLIGFAFPLAFALSAFLAFTIYSDLSDSVAPQTRISNTNIGDNLYQENSLEGFRAKCESPAETAFLDAMIKAFNLTPKDSHLEGEGLSLRMQVPVHRYRVDFLVDERLVVEIDGAAWHSSREAIQRDRIRDAYLKGAGYYVLRIAAKIPLFKPQMISSLVIQAREDMQKEISNKSRHKSELRKEILKPKNLISSVNTTLNAFSESLDTILEKAEKHQIIALGKNEADLIWFELRDRANMLLSHSKVMLEQEERVSRLDEQSQILFQSTLNAMLVKVEENKISNTEISSSAKLSFAENLEKANYLFSELRNSINNIVDTEAKEYRMVGMDKSYKEYKSFVQSINSEIAKDEKLAERFTMEWRKKLF